MALDTHSFGAQGESKFLASITIIIFDAKTFRAELKTGGLRLRQSFVRYKGISVFV